MFDAIQDFLSDPPKEARPIYNERSLQLELGYHLRCQGFAVEFERPFKAPRPAGSTKLPKTNLDLLVKGHGETAAIELKVPLNKRHPETLYDYCADIEFVEALVRNSQVDNGFCLSLPDDHVFWKTVGAAVRFTTVSASRIPS